MKPLSPETSMLIENLHSAESALNWPARKRQRLQQLLSGIGNSGEPAALHSVLPYIFSSDSVVAGAAAESISALVRVMVNADIVCFLQSSGHLADYIYPYEPAVSRLRAQDVGWLTQFGEHSVHLLGLYSLHWDGFVREQAVKHLATVSDGRELPYLLVRSNDWVDAVRHRATSALKHRLTPANASSIAAHFPLISRLFRCSRIEDEFKNAVADFLRFPEMQDTVSAGMDAEDLEVRLICYGAALNSPAFDKASVIRRAANDLRPRIRLWAARSADGALSGFDLRGALEMLDQDKFAPVRLQALRMWLVHFPDESQERLQTALFDAQPPVRDFAQFTLRKLRPDADIADYYRSAIQSAEKQDLTAAISGLGETGSPSDVQLIMPYAMKGRARSRRAALRAIGRLDRTGQAKFLLQMLGGNLSSLSSEARRIICTKPAVVSATDLWTVFESTPHLKARANVVLALRCLPKWESVPYLIRAHCASEPEVRDVAEDQLSRWIAAYGATIFAGSPHQLEALRDAIDECGHVLHDSTVRYLRFAVLGERDSH